MKEELEAGSEGLCGAFHAGPAAHPRPDQGSPAERIAAALGGDLRSGNDGDELLAEVARRVEACAAALLEAAGRGRRDGPGNGR